MNQRFKQVAYFYIGLIVFSCILSLGEWLGSLPVFLSSFACMGLLGLAGTWMSTQPDYLDDRDVSEKRDRSNWISN